MDIIQTTIKCPDCNIESVSIQPFNSLQLEIENENIKSINDAIKYYFAKTEVEYKCKCPTQNRSIEVIKESRIKVYPHVLCLQLKRFKNVNEKINKEIEIDGEIDLSSYIIENLDLLKNKPVKYKIVSTVDHLGSELRLGHYTANAFKENGILYLFDDKNFRKIWFDSMFFSNSYLLFYELIESSSENTKNIESNVPVPSDLETQHSFPIKEVQKVIIPEPNNEFTIVDVEKPKNLKGTAHVVPSQDFINIMSKNPLTNAVDKGKFKFEYIVEPKKLLIGESDWLHIFDETTKRYKTDTYITYFRERLNAEYENNPCILKSKSLRYR